MSKLVAAFTLAFFMCAILSGIAEAGSGNIGTTRLYEDVTATDDVLRVYDTSAFLGSSTLTIGNEDIRYTSKTTSAPFQFTGCTRGYNETEAIAHIRGAAVYSPEAGVINSILGFNVASTSSTIGKIELALFLPKFATVTIPRLVSWNFSYLKEGNMQYIRYILFCISAGFVVTIIMAVVSAIGGVLQSIFVR